jgi:hypothetical protein
MIMESTDSQRSHSSREEDIKLSRRWNCTDRTIRAWRKAGCPLDSEESTRTWLLGQRQIPAGTAAILRPKKAPTAVPVPKQGRRLIPKRDQAPVNGESGAGAALQRLQEAERAGHEEWKRLLYDPEATVEEIDDSRDAWLKIAQSLRQWELAVEQDRRQSGELLPRADLETFAMGFLSTFAGSLKAGLEAICPRLAGLDAPQAVWSALAPAFNRSLEESAGKAVAWPYNGKVCPEWLSKSVSEAIRRHL